MSQADRQPDPVAAISRRAPIFLDGEQALFVGLVRAEFGPRARIVLFDGDDGSLYAEVEAGPAGHCIQRFDGETCESEWVGDCENVANPVHVSDRDTVLVIRFGQRENAEKAREQIVWAMKRAHLIPFDIEIEEIDCVR